MAWQRVTNFRRADNIGGFTCGALFAVRTALRQPSKAALSQASPRTGVLLFASMKLASLSRELPDILSLLRAI